MNDLNQNEQRANGNEVSPESPACFFPTAPGDGGFGRTPSDEVRRASFCIPVPDPDAAPRPPITTGSVTFQGNRFFSTQSAIEAADTMPAFHDNSAATLEDVVEFYDSDIFNDSITGAGNGFIIPPLNRNRIAAFLRAMNVLENIRGAIAGIDVGTAVGLVDANRDTRDAVRVLRQGAIRIHQNDALPALRSARVALQSRRFALARVELERARGLILD
jgi:hypothetical protein